MTTMAATVFLRKKHAAGFHGVGWRHSTTNPLYRRELDFAQRSACHLAKMDDVICLRFWLWLLSPVFLSLSLFSLLSLLLLHTRHTQTRIHALLFVIYLHIPALYPFYIFSNFLSAYFLFISFHSFFVVASLLAVFGSRIVQTCFLFNVSFFFNIVVRVFRTLAQLAPPHPQQHAPVPPAHSFLFPYI